MPAGATRHPGRGAARAAIAAPRGPAGAAPQRRQQAPQRLPWLSPVTPAAATVRAAAAAAAGLVALLTWPVPTGATLGAVLSAVPPPGKARFATADGAFPGIGRGRAEGRSGLHSSRHATGPASAVEEGSGKLTFQKRYLNDTVRNAAFIAMIGGAVAGSWWFTGKWWKLPLFFALPSMLYRLWVTRMDTEKLASMSASVDTKYVATTEKEQKELHTFMCSGCGYTLFPARGREAAFFTDNFKCPMCGAPKSDFFDMSDDADQAGSGSTDATPQAASADIASTDAADKS